MRKVLLGLALVLPLALAFVANSSDQSIRAGSSSWSATKTGRLTSGGPIGTYTFKNTTTSSGRKGRGTHYGWRDNVNHTVQDTTYGGNGRGCAGRAGVDICHNGPRAGWPWATAQAGNSIKAHCAHWCKNDSGNYMCRETADGAKGVLHDQCLAWCSEAPVATDSTSTTVDARGEISFVVPEDD